MNNGRVFRSILFACLLIVCASAAVLAQDSVPDFDLAISEIEAIPLSAGGGEETTFTVTYENLSATAVPADAMLDLVLTVTETQTGQLIEQCRQPVDLAGLTSNDGPQALSFLDCAISPQGQNTHLVRAEFVEGGQEVSNGPYNLIVGDAQGDNNGGLTTLLPATIVNDSNLPADLARIFAGLAIFFAVMALVSAGTEVVIDSLKVGVGLKRKVTTMEALERMEKYLPGELASLSVSAASREQYKRMSREIRSTLGAVLQGTSDFVALREQVASGEFGDAFRKAEELLPQVGEVSEENIYQLKKQLFAFTNRLANAAENQLQLKPETVQPMRDQIAQEISLFDGQNPDDFLQSLFDTLQDAHFWSVQIADGWLNEQEEILFDRSSTKVLANFESDVRPMLEGVGFAPESVDLAERELASRLRIVETGISQNTDIFVSSVKNVLDAVELRRYETQSPARKVWRILRSWYGGIFPPLRLRSVFVPSLFLAALALYGTWLAQISSRSNSLTQYVTNQIPSLEPFPWLLWLLLFFVIAYLSLLLLYLIRKARGRGGQPWFIGLYGATALSLLVGLFLLLILWLLQATSASSTSGQFELLTWTQPWWSWLVLLSVSTLILLLFVGQVGKAIYERLVRSAVADGRMAEGRQLLQNATVLSRVETFWNLLRHGFDVTEVDPDTFNLPETVTSFEDLSAANGQPGFEFSAETTAQFIMQRTDQQRDEETSRLRILRVAAIVIGLVLAYLLQIDVIRLLGEAFPGVLDSLNVIIVSGDTLHAWRSWLPANKTITVGIILTAFAASAGSAFWHDRLDKLQASKKGAQAAATLLSQASQVVETVKRN
ncbi:MAG: hypothetical protein GWP61_03410 [Chloroflexi bacterium]|jgi:hypothetical protein|nr:hypothetical protein [Chloroflexota bacterium]